MNSSIVLSITTFVYGLAGACYIFAWIFKKTSIDKLAQWITILGLAGNTLGIIARWVESYNLEEGGGHAPLSNLYESLVFFAWTIVLIFLFMAIKNRYRNLGAITVPLAFLAMAYASLSPNISDKIQPLIPALKSNWLIAHVISCFIGYAAFAIAFGTSGIYLLRQWKSDGTGGLLERFPDFDTLDELTHQLVKFGFLWLTIGIITGAVWANSAWGRYWGWDPKEVWSLITWLVYATMLHVRYFAGWKVWQSKQGRLLAAFFLVLVTGIVFVYFEKLFLLPIFFLILMVLIMIFGADRRKLFAYLSIVGFATVMFTYFGVNLLPGLHSYQSMGQ